MSDKIYIATDEDCKIVGELLNKYKSENEALKKELAELKKQVAIGARIEAENTVRLCEEAVEQDDVIASLRKEIEILKMSEHAACEYAGAVGCEYAGLEKELAEIKSRNCEGCDEHGNCLILDHVVYEFRVKTTEFVCCFWNKAEAVEK